MGFLSVLAVCTVSVVKLAIFDSVLGEEGAVSQLGLSSGPMLGNNVTCGRYGLLGKSF